MKKNLKRENLIHRSQRMENTKSKEEKDAFISLKKKLKLKKDDFRVNTKGHIYYLSLSDESN